MQKKPSKKAISFHQFLQRVKRFISLGEQHLEETHFYIYRTDNCPASTPLADWRQSSWPVWVADRPQVFADDNMPATVAEAT